MCSIYYISSRMIKINIRTLVVEISTRCFLYDFWEKERVTWSTLEEAKLRYEKEFWEATDIKDRQECDYEESFALTEWAEERIEEMEKMNLCRHEWNRDEKRWMRKVKIREYLQRYDHKENVVLISTVY